MTKINQEEYHVLKSLGDKWKWIARDLDGNHGGELFVYSGKPYKDYYTKDWRGGFLEWLSNDTHRFQFIQWENDEPYNIQELIEEYEDESEEKEVKKDIEWLNNEVEKRIKKIRTDEVSFAGSDFFDEGYIHGMKDVQAIANQLDEPEATLDRAFEKVAESYLMTKEEIWRHLERLEAYGGKVTYGELDEPETVADVVTTFWKSYERLKEVMSMEVEELEE